MTTETMTPEQQEAERKRIERETKRAEMHRKLQLRTADGIDKAIRTIKVTGAKLDETKDAATIETVEGALDTLRDVRDQLRASTNGNTPATDDAPATDEAPVSNEESVEKQSGKNR